MQSDDIVFTNERRELQPNTKRPELNCDDADALTALNHRNRKLTASQKTRLLSVQSQEVRLSENLQHRLAFKISNRSSEVDIWTKREDVQEIAKRHRGIRNRSARAPTARTVGTQ